MRWHCRSSSVDHSVSIDVRCLFFSRDDWQWPTEIWPTGKFRLYCLSEALSLTLYHADMILPLFASLKCRKTLTINDPIVYSMAGLTLRKYTRPIWKYTTGNQDTQDLNRQWQINGQIKFFFDRHQTFDTQDSTCVHALVTRRRQWMRNAEGHFGLEKRRDLCAIEILAHVVDYYRLTSLAAICAVHRLRTSYYIAKDVSNAIYTAACHVIRNISHQLRCLLPFGGSTFTLDIPVTSALIVIQCFSSFDKLSDVNKRKIEISFNVSEWNTVTVFKRLAFACVKLSLFQIWRKSVGKMHTLL